MVLYCKRVIFLAYFFKKSNLKKGVYLQIYESFYDSVKKQTAHKSYKAIGYVNELIEHGIEDPVSFYADEVRKLNQIFQESKNQERKRLITEESPEKLLGYFPLKNLNDALSCKRYIDLMQTATNFRFNIFEMISALIYARVVHPCSKLKTYDKIIPKLFDGCCFSIDQLYSGLGLMLDAHQIPIGMKMYPGNESEKPVIRSIINELKQRNNIQGRTIHVADKGLNCINNIMHALKAGDGYIFSKSVKTLPETEQTWILLENDYTDVKNNRNEVVYRIKECTDDFTYTYKDTNGNTRKINLTEKQKYEINRQVEKAKILRATEAKKTEYGDSAKYVTFIVADKKGTKTDGKIKVELNDTAIEKAKKMAGYNMMVTSETRMSASEIHAAYHNLWRIEESFRIMKSQLDARPVYMQKEETITGHFLICYLSVLLSRLLQIFVLGDQYGTEEIFDFIRDFRVAKVSDRKYINLTRNTSFVKELTIKTGLPLTSYFLGNEEINKVLNHRF